MSNSFKDMALSETGFLTGLQDNEHTDDHLTSVHDLLPWHRSSGYRTSQATQ